MKKKAKVDIPINPSLEKISVLLLFLTINAYATKYYLNDAK